MSPVSIEGDEDIILKPLEESGLAMWPDDMSYTTQCLDKSCQRRRGMDNKRTAIRVDMARLMER